MNQGSFELLVTVGWVVLVGVLMWFGNRLITKALDRKLPWLNYGIGRFILQIGAIVLYSLGIVNLSYLTFKLVFTESLPTLDQFTIINIYGALIIIPISSVYFGVYFLKSWMKSQLEAEKFEKETAKAQLLTLRNHLDPHFLFNNLNILSALIDKDRELSQKYLDKFAEVYRVILKSDKEELIPLQQEIQFIDAYLYLVKIRFAELLTVEIDISDSSINLFLPPLTLQMLLENALKHNIIDEDEPLVVSIRDLDGFVEVRNTLNKKKITEPASGSGLINISSRYAYFTDAEVKVRESADEFIVKVPLIDFEEYENSDT